jgi:hypothetical protein
MDLWVAAGQVLGGKHDDGELRPRWIPPDASDQFKAAHLGHEQVDNGRCHRTPLQRFQGEFAARSQYRQKSYGPQGVRDQFAGFLLVVND